jgi:hypothetical protein
MTTSAPIVPNRSDIVSACCTAHPHAFPPGALNDPARLKLLQTVIVPALDQADPGRWGVLTKTDQPIDGGYVIPCDIAAYRYPTGQVATVDVLTATGANWQVQAYVDNDAWVWTAVDVPAPATDPSEPVWYAPDQPIIGVAELPPEIVATLIPQPSGQWVLIDGTGAIVSVQPDGSREWRNAVGPWELADRATALIYRGAGPTYIVIVRPR